MLHSGPVAVQDGEINELEGILELVLLHHLMEKFGADLSGEGDDVPMGDDDFEGEGQVHCRKVTDKIETRRGDGREYGY